MNASKLRIILSARFMATFAVLICLEAVILAFSSSLVVIAFWLSPSFKSG